MGKPVKILFVENNPEDLEIIGGFFREMGRGYELLNADSPAAAIRLLQSGDISAIIFDPASEGKVCDDFFSHLRVHPELPVIILTSFEEGSSKWDKRLPRIHIYVYRHTLNRESLSDAIASALDQRKLVLDLGETMANLERSNKALEQFAYAVSHDLNEPLRSIAGYIGLVSKKYSNLLDDQGRGYLGKISASALKLQNMITAVLDYSRISTQRQPPVKVDCNELMREVVANLESAIRGRNAEVSFSKLPVVSADRIQLLRVFQNLVSNGIKFQKDRKPVVKVAARRKDNFWHFSVKDNGIGIDSKNFDTIFVIFKRLNSQDEFEGSGIGLPVCRKIIESHGGSIWVESEPGQGTTFHFTLPSTRTAGRKNGNSIKTNDGG